jgi:hypothetical protein
MLQIIQMTKLASHLLKARSWGCEWDAVLRRLERSQDFGSVESGFDQRMGQSCLRDSKFSSYRLAYAWGSLDRYFRNDACAKLAYGSIEVGLSGIVVQVFMKNAHPHNYPH